MITTITSPPSLIFLLDYPIKLCATTTLCNVSQVDRVWTFLPTIYTAYWALLPFWPPESAESRRYLVPSVPQQAAHLARDFSPRVLLMLGLTVRVLPF
ncbi:hypothetical protein BGW80DRAFT_1342690 [Lactifluus volemus]|nr:hypothetical protein BGW80DRAFT_1342690 [Lactifluus volemus]